MISAASRESEHPKITAVGCWESVSEDRRAAFWLGWATSPVTKRSLPACSRRQASAGLSCWAAPVVGSVIGGVLILGDVGNVASDRLDDRFQGAVEFLVCGVSADDHSGAVAVVVLSLQHVVAALLLLVGAELQALDRSGSGHWAWSTSVFTHAG